MLREKAGKTLPIVIETERLVGRDMNARILGRILAFLGLYNAGGVAEDGFELVVGLFPKLVAVAEE